MSYSDVIIGIDYSVTSPGIVIYKDDKYFFYFFAKRKREEGLYQSNDNWVLQALEYPEYNTREERFDKLANIIHSVICNHVYGILTCKVGIEGYSYGSTGQRVSEIYENGSIIRNKLYHSGWDITEYPPSEIKKYFTGKGNAGKSEMMYQFEYENVIDLYAELGLKESKNGNVPNPCQDLADAYAIVQKLRGITITHNPVNKVDGILKKLDLHVK